MDKVKRSRSPSMTVSGERIVFMKKTTWGFALNFPKTFGDGGKQWIEGRGVVWKALQMDAVIQPPTSLDNSPNFGWWLGLVDLLSFAVGEDDIAEYLRN